MGFALSSVLLALGVILVVHHRIPAGIQPAVVAAGAALVVVALLGLVLSARFSASFGGPLRIDRDAREPDE